MKQWLSRLWGRLHARMFPRVTTVVFSKQAQQQMQALARATHPKEAFGVLVGSTKEEILEVEDVVYQPFANTTHSAHVAIDRYAIPNMVGTFHSHPTADDRPSTADKRVFAQYPGVHCISGAPYTTSAVYTHHSQYIRHESLGNTPFTSYRVRGQRR